MSISSITSTPTVQAGPVTGSGPVVPVQPVPGPTRLGPAVTFDIHTKAPDTETPPPEQAAAQAASTEARIHIDRDTRTIVYQEVDASSGDIIIQLPDPVVLKARAYADRAAAAEAQAESHPVDRTA